MNTSPDPFTTEDLVVYSLGEATAAQGAAIEAAAKSDPVFGARVKEIAILVQTLRLGVLGMAPRELERAAMSLWRPSRVIGLGEWLEGLVQHAARLVFDSHSTPALAGFRGETTGRHMTFEDGEVEIDVVIEDEEDQLRTIRGQVTGTKAIEAAVLAVDGASIVASSGIDPDGMFVLSFGSGGGDLAIKTERGAYRLSDVL